MLNSNGTIAIYESGPDGVNGIGFNDIIGSVTNVSFPRAKAMIYDYNQQNGGVLIGHTDESGLGQISRLGLTATPIGQLPLNPAVGGFILPPTYRQKEWTVVQRIGGTPAPGSFVDQISGNSIIDMAHDDLLNFGGGGGQVSPYFSSAASTPYFHSGKHTLKVVGGVAVQAVTPKLLFIALSDVGNVDVFEIDTGTRLATISVPGVRVVANYWRQ